MIFPPPEGQVDTGQIFHDLPVGGFCFFSFFSFFQQSKANIWNPWMNQRKSWISWNWAGLSVEVLKMSLNPWGWGIGMCEKKKGGFGECRSCLELPGKGGLGGQIFPGNLSVFVEGWHVLMECVQGCWQLSWLLKIPLPSCQEKAGNGARGFREKPEELPKAQSGSEERFFGMRRESYGAKAVWI